jgi:hypothetical protein
LGWARFLAVALAPFPRNGYARLRTSVYASGAVIRLSGFGEGNTPSLSFHWRRGFGWVKSQIFTEYLHLTLRNGVDNLISRKIWGLFSFQGTLAAVNTLRYISIGEGYLG